MFGNMPKIVVIREQSEVVADTKLRQKRIDCACLNPGPSAAVSQICRANVILTIWDQKGDCGEVL
jgi:hypothetical protein